MKKGDILKGSKRGRDAAYHYIVFLDGKDDNSFIGVVLTHSDRYKNNILMKEGHFQETTAEGKKYEFRFNNTHLVKGRFIKLQDWRPFRKIGELTQVGIEFVESETNGKKPILWDEYISGEENR